MKLIGYLHAYDMLDQVCWTVQVRAYERGDPPTSALVYRLSGAFTGTGETQPDAWLEDLLTDVHESL